MAEDKDILFNTTGSDADDVSNSNEKNEELEISGEINQFIRFMMDDNFKSINIAKYTDMAFDLVAAYESGYKYSYYNVSAEIYAHWDMNEQQLINLSSNIESLKHIMHTNERMYKKAIKGIDELYDHIMLEIVRITDHKKNLDRINEIIDQFKQESADSFKKQDVSLIQTVAEFENRFREADESFSRQNSEINEISKNAKKLKKKVNNVYSQFVSILGIFTAIVIVFFGGVSVFSTF